MCPECGWRFEHRPPAGAVPDVGTTERPMIVEIRPDLFERRQMARWILAAFEVLLLTGLVSVICGWLGAEAATEFSRLIGNDIFSAILTAAIWGWFGTIAGAYITLRYLARR